MRMHGPGIFGIVSTPVAGLPSLDAVEQFAGARGREAAFLETAAGDEAHAAVHQALGQIFAGSKDEIAVSDIPEYLPQGFGVLRLLRVLRAMDVSDSSIMYRSGVVYLL